jgi:hypothetical protein
LRADAEDGFRDDDGGGGTDGRGEERELDHDASPCTDHEFNNLFSGRGRDGFVAKEERYLSLQWRDLEEEWNVDQRIPLRIRW